MAEPQKRSSTFQFLLLFAVIFFGTQFLMQFLFPKNVPITGMTLRAADATLTIGHHPELVFENHPATVENNGLSGWVRSQWCNVRRLTSGKPSKSECQKLWKTITGEPSKPIERCPQLPVDLFDIRNPGTPQEQAIPLSFTGSVMNCKNVPSIAVGESAQISLAPWKYSLFERVGTFEARLPSTVKPATTSGTGTALASATASMTARFTISEPGVITKLFRTFITAPFLNALIFIASLLPGYNLGLAIIIITILVKLLLYLPTKHALEGQKKMQLLQPKLEALKHQYGSDQVKLQEETMKLWKEHKINPFSACLPTLLQLPILIGLFYTIRDGSHLELSHHLIYSAYQHLSWNFGTNFLGLDLLKPNLYIMPPLLVILQFLQMKLSFAINARKKAKSAQQKVIDVPQKDQKDAKKEPSSPQDMQQRVMTYGLPLMIGFFAIRFPAAVSIYWGISTLFSIGQQILVNREHLTVQS